MTSITQHTRSVAVLCTFLLAGVIGGCDGLLDVTNPAAITEDNLTGDDQTVQFMMNGVQGEFRREYAWLAAHSAVFTDEAIQGHPWPPWNVYDERTITPDSPAYDGLSYQLIQRARGTADQLIPKMETALGDRAASSVELATAYAYAGYSYLMAADFFCETPINLSAAHPPEEVYQMAIERFQKAIDIATAAGTKEGAAAALNLARVGIARAYLSVNDKPKAIAAASLVPTNFSASVHYVSDPSDWQVYNFMQWFAGFRYEGELDLALDPVQFAGVNDPRIPFDNTLRRLGSGTRDGFLAYQTPSYSEWAPTVKKMFGETTAIRFASGLEAQYIIAEAGGLSAGNLRTFIDSRRTVGGQGAFGGTDAQLFGELLNQRYRDFFLDGHRMGDLRRYKKYYSLDFWPHGTMPGLTTQYGTQECWPVAQSEISSNPNLQ